MPLLASQIGSVAVGPTSGGKMTPINNLGTSAVQIIGSNPQRYSISFINPGTVIVYVAPLVNSVGNTFTPALGLLGGTIPIAPGAFIQLQGECQQGWQALAASGSNNPLSVLESNT